MPAPWNAPQSRKLGTSGSHFVPPPSPSIAPEAIENIEPKDRLRHECAAALETARSCGAIALKVTRQIHADASLAIPDRHRHAHDRSFQLIHPALAPLEAARAKNSKARDELMKIVAGPAVELSDVAAFEVRSKLKGLPKSQLMAAISRSIAKGDKVVGALLGPGADRFFSEGILTDAEIESVRQQWALARYPEEVARLRLLEKDDRALAVGAAALASFQRGCSLPALVLAEVRDSGRGGSGAPTPVDRSRSTGFAGIIARARAHR
jgi:hypothetical protein